MTTSDSGAYSPGGARWTIRAHVQITPDADWTGHLVPQVVQAHSLTAALDKAQARPLADWMHDEDKNGDQIDCADCPTSPKTDDSTQDES